MRTPSFVVGGVDRHVEQVAEELELSLELNKNGIHGREYINWCHVVGI